MSVAYGNLLGFPTEAMRGMEAPVAESNDRRENREKSSEEAVVKALAYGSPSLWSATSASSNDISNDEAIAHALGGSTFTRIKQGVGSPLSVFQQERDYDSESTDDGVPPCNILQNLSERC